MGVLLAITKDNFEQEVLKSDLPVLLDFWGPRCSPCLALMPEVEKLADVYEGQIKFCKVNSAENRRFCMELKVMSLPTFHFYKEGKLTAQLQTSFGRAEIEKQLKALLE